MDQMEEEDTEKSEYSHRLTLLMVDLGTEVLLNLFKRDIPPNQSVSDYLTSNADTINKLENVFNGPQWALVNTTPPDVSEFDISLLYILVSNLSRIQPPQGGWSQRMPLPSDISAGALLMRLKTVRNTIAHSSIGKMKKSEFEKLWTVATDVLKGLAREVGQTEETDVQQKIENILQKPIGDEIFKHHILVQWAAQDKLGDISRKIDTHDTARMDDDQEQTRQRHQEILSELEVLKTKMDTQDIHTTKDSLAIELQDLSAKIDLLNPNPQASSSYGSRDYKTLRESLKKELLEHYINNGICRTAIPVCFQGQAIDVDDIFVMPSLKAIKPGTSNVKPYQYDATSDRITAVHELFRKKGASVRKVCIIGDAGHGKTILCQRIVSQWCKVHTGQQDRNMPQEEEQFFKRFEFLFYLTLRNHRTTDIVEMIRIENVREQFYDHLKQVFRKESENCLILLDGLDEWTPSKESTGRYKVPFIDHKEKFSLMFTSRPWRVEDIRPRLSDVGHEVKLCGVMEDSLIETVVKVLNEKSVKKVDWKRFKWVDKESLNSQCGVDQYRYPLSSQYEKVQQMVPIPIILTQMVCMWYDGEEIGQTRIQMYFNMLNFLFHTAQKHCTSTFEPRPVDNPELAVILNDLTYCRMYSNVLFKLSELAFHMMFVEKESCLDCSHEDRGIRQLGEKDVKFCLQVGILCQSKSSVKVSAMVKFVFFLHKTFQNFLAALFVAYGGRITSFNEMLEALKTLDDVFEMSEVLVFLSGLRPDLIGDISHHIADLADRDERVVGYRHSFRAKASFLFCDDDRNVDTVSKVENLIFDCIAEVGKDGEIGRKVELHDVLGSVKYRDGPLEKLDSYLISEKVKSYNLPHNATGYWTKLRGHCLVKLCMQVQSQEHMEHLTYLVERCSSSLTCLSVSGPLVEIHASGFLTAVCNVTHLTCFGVEYMKLNHSDIEQLGQVLSWMTQLQEIKLWNIKCTTCVQGQCNYIIDLTHHRQLHYLDLSDLTGDVLTTTDTPLDYCKVCDVKSGSLIIDKLKSSRTLQELCALQRIVNTDGGAGPLLNNGPNAQPPPLCLSKVLTDVIPTLCNLRTLQLWNIDLKQNILRLSPGMVSLEEVTLWNIKMTSQCLLCFINSLPRKEYRVNMNKVYIYPKTDLPDILKYIIDRHQVVTVGNEMDTNLTLFVTPALQNR